METCGFKKRGDGMSGGWIAGIDLGGTKILTGISDTHGNLAAEIKIETRAKEGGDAVVQRMAGSVRQLLHQFGAGDNQLLGIVVGAPGPLSPATGVIHQAPNLGWKEFPLREKMADHFTVPIHVDNDANVAALGEYQYGYHGRFQDMLYITVGTGVGGGIIIGGRIYYGASGGAGEFGHMIIMPEGGPLCGCGSRGCLETLASGTAIARNARELASQGKGKSLLKIAGDVESITAETVGMAARNGDTEALAIINQAGYYLGIGLASLVNIFNPAAIVVGGGVTAGLSELLLAPAREEMKKRVLCTPGEDVQVLPALLGNRAGLMGCLALAQRIFNSEKIDAE